MKQKHFTKQKHFPLINGSKFSCTCGLLHYPCRLLHYPDPKNNDDLEAICRAFRQHALRCLKLETVRIRGTRIVDEICYEEII